MTRILFLAALALALVCVASNADAKTRHRHHPAAPVQQQSCFLFFCAPAVAVRSDATGNPLSPLVDAAAFAAGVPVHLAHAVIRQESNYNPSLRGAAGEYGIGQIKCQTARSVGFAGDCLQLFDASTNLTYSMRYLRLALDRGGAGCAGVSLYQRGVYGRPSCSGYGRQVMARAGMSP